MSTRRDPPRLFLLLVALGPGLLACNLLGRAAASPTPPPTPIPTAPPVIEEFDGSLESLNALNQAIRENPAGVAQRAAAYLQADDAKVRFAAVYALSLTADASQAEALLPVLEDPDPGLRTIAAGALIGLGRKESIPVLIAVLGSDELLPMSHPPRPLSSLASAALRHYTGQDFGMGAAAVQAWEAWWSQAGAQLRWDASGGRFVP